MPFSSSDFSFSNISDFAVGLSVLHDEVNPSTLTTICPLLGTKITSFSYTKTKNGAVVVVGHNFHKMSKRHSQSKSNRFLVLL